MCKKHKWHTHLTEGSQNSAQVNGLEKRQSAKTFKLSQVTATASRDTLLYETLSVRPTGPISSAFRRVIVRTVALQNFGAAVTTTS